MGWIIAAGLATLILASSIVFYVVSYRSIFIWWFTFPWEWESADENWIEDL